ncbi:hypothetical protein CLOBOL_00165 [Enterocloster bolteae ATCC BAA-613]|uniref:Uncharacterized protein n=1 Tax=Enterocloster bolteae (strain ATCC BAA-613 / DSM 15670 / CCUG 46953 / JCM 12243 / WAL 16351) TaxID=411902 RepID=A8RGL0_ENTBW|nr:hypothetical protein CLOBOL_00165 [Enterocloster bolteae ATCC BAA-613]
MDAVRFCADASGVKTANRKLIWNLHENSRQTREKMV